MFNASQMTFSQLGTERPNFAREEEKILQYWKKIDAFKQQLKRSEGSKPFTFYDGPPFATGKPHYGHILAGTIKDVICRYATQNGYHVERRFGWDTHGLPVEYEIEKSLGITSRDDVFKMGIAKYNNECRKIVMRCASDWEYCVERMGRWIDFVNDYKTLDKDFMESVWWVFSEMARKGLVYRGYKVMPYSTALNTPLSNFEAKSNYKKRQDPAVIVNFPLIGEENTYLLAWTTTPWTLPSNLALCVNAKLDYVKFQSSLDGNFYICGEKTLSSVKKGVKKLQAKVVEKMKGKDLVGREYKPLFDYFADRKNNFRVLSDEYVGEAEGTAIVHQAPGFGEDDFRVCQSHGVTEKGEEVPCPVDHSGRFTDPVADFKGTFVLDANRDIMKMLKERNRVWSVSNITHDYPYCWRSETPLIYRAIPSWFINVESIVPRLLENNNKTYWVPEYVKDKRFHNWLEQARDWAVSRNRYWGTPLPIWISDDGTEWEVISSVAELEERTGVQITDLHRENVDDLTFKSKKSGKVLRRVDEVFDCWFESGSMPYAQCHYPFAFPDKEKFLKERFPADFIAEGLDQTRGWFYTLLVISTALFDKPAWKNLIVNGLVLAEDGKKMSKRLKNYPDPNIIFDNYGADALRLYLCNSPVVRAESLCFKEKGVAGIIKDVLSPWYNAYKFFIENAGRYERSKGVLFAYDDDIYKKVTNIMDQWILSELQSLISFVRAEMEGYRLYTVMPELVRFIDKLCNWYVRMNRRRLRGQTSEDDASASLATLYTVLLNLCQLMAPMTPFIVETMYLNLRGALGKDSPESVHFLPVPEPNKEAISLEIERRVHNLQKVIELGRNVRAVHNLRNKQPLLEAMVVHQDKQFLEDVKGLSNYVESELNVKEVKFSNELASYITLSCEPVYKALGQDFKAKTKNITKALRELQHEQLLELANTGKLTVCGESLTNAHVNIVWNFTGDKEKYGDAEGGGALVLLNKTVNKQLELEGTAREVVTRIQKLRKKGGLTSADVVTVYYSVDDEKSDVYQAFESYGGFIEGLTGVTVAPRKLKSSKVGTIAEEATTVGKEHLTLHLCRPQVFFAEGALSKFDSEMREAIEYFVHSKDYRSLRNDYLKTGSVLKFMIDSTEVTLESGKDFMFDPRRKVQAK